MFERYGWKLAVAMMAIAATVACGASATPSKSAAATATMAAMPAFCGTEIKAPSARERAATFLPGFA